MKTKQTNPKGRGFTIIEVMIVLTIAGLILLIVFLAVPALQRNSRNTQRRSDVARILGAVNEYVSNNNGSLPTGANVALNSAPVAGIGTSLFPTLTQYTAANVTWNYVASAYASDAAAQAAAPAATTTDTVKGYNYMKCGAAGAVTATGASSRSIVALYGIETGGTVQAQCTES